jgi:hypothetical protein
MHAAVPIWRIATDPGWGTKEPPAGSERSSLGAVCISLATTMGKVLRSVALITAASLLFSTTARGADPTGPAGGAKGSGHASTASDAARLDAEKRLDEGLDRYGKGDFEGARLAFAQAYAVLTSLDLLYNLMRSEVKAGHPLEALVHIHQMLRDPKATTEDHAKAERLLEEANRVTGHVAVEAPEGAEILLDRVPSGEAPIRDAYDVVPGKHVVEAKINGTTRVIEVDAPAGQIVTARFATATGSAPTVTAPTPVSNTAPVPTPPPPPPPVKPAPVRKETSPPSPSPEHAASVSPMRVIVPAVIGGLAVIGLGVGIGMGAASQGEESSATNFRAQYGKGFCANQASATCQQYQSILGSQQQDTNVSRVMLVSGGVLAVAAAVTYLAWPGSHREGGSQREAEKERRVWVAPTVGGVVVGGRF